METTKRLAASEVILLFPAVLFMTAVVVRYLGPLQDEPARSAQQIVMWYAGRQWTLWVLLIALPLTVLATGCAALLRRRDTLLVATTLTAGVILAIVGVHMLVT